MTTRHDYRTNPIADRFGLPTQDFTTPDITDVVVVEEFPLAVGNASVIYGTPRTGDPAKLLVHQEFISKGGTNERNVRRIYAAPRSAQDFYNAVYKYSEEANDSPVFVRVYFELRSTYAPRTKAAPLDTIIKLALTAGGTGYARDNVAVSFSAGGGTGATAVAEVQNGAVVSLQITNGGTGYTSAPTVSIAGGIGATATASIQSQACALVSEESVAADGELGSLFLKVTRVYMTLPGPAITTTKLDDDGDVVTITKTIKAFGSITSDETIVSNAWTLITKGEGNSVYATEIKEERALPGTPIVKTEKDDDGVTLTTSRRRRAIADITVSEGISGTTWTRVKMEPITELVGWEITITRPIPGAEITTTKLDEDGDVVTVTRTKKAIGAIISDETLVAGVWTLITKGPGDAIVADEIKETRTIAGTPIVKTEITEDGMTLTTSRRRQATIAITVSETVASNVWTKVSAQPITELVSWEITESRPIPGNEMISWLIDGETQTPVKVITKLVVKPVVDPVATTGTAVEYRPISLVHGQLTTTALVGYGAVTRTEKSDVQYEYPRIITAITGSAIEMLGGQAKYNLTVTAKANRRRTKQATTVITYGAYADLTYDAPFDPALIDLIYDGWFINIRENNVWLENGYTLSFSTASNNPIYGYIAESYPTPAGQGAFPTGEKVISCRIRPWKYGIYRKEVTKITI